jgi:nucleotide-binding universal stress UspA family protein
MPDSSKPAVLQLSTVIYGTDFSVSSESAGSYAALVARRFSAKLVVAHAFTLSQAGLEVESEGKGPCLERKDLQSLLIQKSSALAAGSLAAVPLLQEGDPKKVLPHLAQVNSPAMLVMGTHGGSWLQRKLIGSVAEHVLRATACPTLTVGPTVPGVTSAQSFRRILCVTDGNANETAPRLALAFAESFTAEIEVVHVGNHDDGSTELDPLHTLSAPDAALPAGADGFYEHTPPIPSRDAHERILAYVGKRGIDLLIIGIHDGSHFGSETKSSGAFSLIIHATCPVLTIMNDHQGACVSP